MNYKEINDFELLYLIKDEDDGYKRVLFQKYENVINKICYKWLKRTNCIEFDDLYQEGIIGLNYAIDNYNSERNSIFYTYAIICIESKISEYVRKYTSKKNTFLNKSISLSDEIDNNFCIEDIISDIDNTSNNMFSEYFFYTIIHFKNNLGEKESQIFELKCNGFSSEEIACLLDIKKANIYYYLNKLKKKLKKLVL